MAPARVNTGNPGVDNASQIAFYFSDDGTFSGTPDVTVNSVVPNFNNNVYDLGGEFQGRYVRMEVVGPAGNVGGGEVQLFGPSSNLNMTQLANPTITNSAPAFNASFDVSLALDGNPFTDYASAGQGANTFIDFDFGSPTNIGGVEYSDRNSSGVAQGSGGGGAADNVQTFDLIFSQDSIFGNIDDQIVSFQSPNAADTELLLINDGLGITAQYVRFDVTQTAGANPGAGEFRFFSAAAPVPEPASLACWMSLGVIGWLFRRRRVRSKR